MSCKYKIYISFSVWVENVFFLASSRAFSVYKCLKYIPRGRWSGQDRKICKSKKEFGQFEKTYRKLYLAESDEIEELVVCKKPCSYNEFKFVNSKPEVMPILQNHVGVWGASRKTQIEEEVLLYPFTSFIAEFGGALGLFLGFSFMTIMR